MHRTTIAAALAAVSLLSLAACKQEPAGTADTTTTATTTTTAAGGTGIDGTWKADMASVQFDSKPDTFMLKDGKFECSSCTPPYSVAADGALHPVTRPASDHISAKIDDEHNVTITAQKNGRQLSQTKYSVSADGKVLTISFNDTSVEGGKPVTGTLTENRTADAPAGAHAVSGSWKIAKYNNISDEGTMMTFKLDGDTLHVSTPQGISYDAKLDGTDTPIKGDPSGATASIKKTGDNTYVETDKLAGKEIGVSTMTVGADGKMHVVNEDTRNGSKTTYDMTRS